MTFASGICRLTVGFGVFRLGFARYANARDPPRFTGSVLRRGFHFEHMRATLYLGELFLAVSIFKIQEQEARAT